MRHKRGFLGRARRTLSAALFLITIAASAQASPKAGPHLTGDEYAALRGSGPETIVTFNLAKSDDGTETTRRVILGPDYAVETGGDTTKVYDFRFRRFLEIDPKTRTFKNQSLYGVFMTRWAFLQNNLSVHAFGANAGLVSKTGLDRFWIEQQNGIAHPSPQVLGILPAAATDTKRGGLELTVTADGTMVAAARMAGPKFPSDAHRRSMAAWLAWSVQMHPEVAKALAGEAGVPTRINLNRFRAIPEEGQDKEYTTAVNLGSFSTATGRLVAMRGMAAAVPSWPPHLSDRLAALMVAAARGEAPGGPVSDADYAGQIRQLTKSGKYLDAHLLALHASHQYDGCRDPSLSSELCQAIIATVRAAGSDPTAARYQQVWRMNPPDAHADTARALITLRSVKLERPEFLEMGIVNELVEAKRKGQLDAALETEFTKIGGSIEKAFAADPYDPAWYRDVDNFLHVSPTSIEEHYGVHVGAYSVIDLARVLPDRRTPAIVASTTQQEQQIANDFPVLLPSF